MSGYTTATGHDTTRVQVRGWKPSALLVRFPRLHWSAIARVNPGRRRLACPCSRFSQDADTARTLL